MSVASHLVMKEIQNLQNKETNDEWDAKFPHFADVHKWN